MQEEETYCGVTPNRDTSMGIASSLMFASMLMMVIPSLKNSSPYSIASVIMGFILALFGIFILFAVMQKRRDFLLPCMALSILGGIACGIQAVFYGLAVFKIYSNDTKLNETWDKIFFSLMIVVFSIECGCFMVGPILLKKYFDTLPTSNGYSV